MTTVAAVLAVAATATDTTSAPEAPKALACIPQDREDKILGLIKSLHHEVKEGCAQVGSALLFEGELAKCASDGYKGLFQQAKILLATADKIRWTTYAGEVGKKIQGVIDSHMTTAREDKAEWDKLSPRLQARNPFPQIVEVPFSDLRPCFTGKDDSTIVVELNRMFPTSLANVAPKGQKEQVWVLKVPFVAAASEEPKSGEQAAA